MPDRRWNSQIIWRISGSEKIHLNPGKPKSLRRTRRFSRRNRRVSTSRLIAVRWWRKKWSLVHYWEIHLPSSRRSECQTLRAERRVIPNSITIYWRCQNYKYDLGCDVWTPHWRLLEYRTGKRSIRCVDGFHRGHHVGWKTPRRVYMVQGAADKEANNILARLLVARNMEKICQTQPTAKKNKWAIEKPKLDIDKARRLRGIYFIDAANAEFKESIKKYAEKVGSPMPAAMPCKTRGRKVKETCRAPDVRKTKYVCIVEADGSTRKRAEGTLHKDHEGHIAGKGINSLSHYNLVHKTTPPPQAMKIPDAKAAVEKEWEKTRENTCMAADESQKQERSDRWSKEWGQKSSFCVIDGSLSS